jgi:hypothetical protein
VWKECADVVMRAIVVAAGEFGFFQARLCPLNSWETDDLMKREVFKVLSTLLAALNVFSDQMGRSCRIHSQPCTFTRLRLSSLSVQRAGILP